MFGACGGCTYQDLPYEEELQLKEKRLHTLLGEQLDFSPRCFESIVPSPEPYHYRTRLDLTLLRTKEEETFLGFMPEGKFRIVPVEACAIARKSISDFLPQLKREASDRLPADYRVANLVVKTADDGRVAWGGIGRRSLQMKPEDYLWTEIRGKRIFHSLDTFFQANTFILPRVLDAIERLIPWNKQTVFFDLYSGVGLFGIFLASRVKKVVMIEENLPSIELARYNAEYHGLKNVEIQSGKVEALLTNFAAGGEIGSKRPVALVDPPRKGLSPEALEALAHSKQFQALFYLSCSPESLARDLAAFLKEGWWIEKIVPFDFFPKTKHLETLVLLRPKAEPPPFLNSTRPLEVEIGCGKGKFLTSRAGTNPQISFLGIDRIEKWVKMGCDNLVFVKAECREFLTQLKPESVSIFHIYFPDPWPKRRHRKRRLVTAGFLDLLLSRLLPGGFIELATDDLDYFQQMKKAAAPFGWARIRESINERPLGRGHQTSYELKYAAVGRPLYYLELQK